jgi:hypothetical protein
MAAELWVYSKGMEKVPQDLAADIAKRFGVARTVAFSDPKRGYLQLREMLDGMDDASIVAVVPSVHALGDSQDDRRRVLESLMASQAASIVACYPHSAKVTTLRDAHSVLQGIHDALFFPFAAAAVPPGRKSIDYPNGWEQLFAQWEAGNITATAFMRKTGLKRGTFYHLVSEYRKRQG